MNTENSVKSDFSLDILQNSQAMVRRTLNWWQSTGDNLPPMRSWRQPHCKAAISRTLVEGEFIGDGGPGDKAYFVMPNA